ncbi:hypothetical protein PHET_03653 [Paragonimus heterotremus]|uniref:DAGKc domain-containing protein n=1 Tax=Paragonimus heterotremus TaxID=100268 RepID=A0A8J4WJ19_9TREM|nr:hypothetical protein PHET_03653 [Paragonimus heterotremus]
MYVDVSEAEFHNGDVFSAYLASRFNQRKIPVHIGLTDSGIRIYLDSDVHDPSVIDISREQLLTCSRANLPFWKRHSYALVKLTYLQKVNGEAKKKYQLLTGLTLVQKSIYLQFSRPGNAVERFVRNVQQTLMVATPALASQKPYLIFINPRSGPGAAESQFRDTVAPLFSRLGIPYVVIKTLYAGHAEDWISACSDMTLDSYRAVIAVSGDGLVYEVINGLTHPAESTHNGDWDQKPVRIPIGVLPAGGGNATAAAICYYSGLSFEKNFLLHSAFLLSHHGPKHTRTLNTSESETDLPRTSCDLSAFTQTAHPIDAFLMENLQTGLTRYGILSVTWGGAAAIDIHSERFRCLGNARFTVASLFSFIRPRYHRATVFYLPFDPQCNHRAETQLKPCNEGDIPRDSGHESACLHHDQVPPRPKHRYLPPMNEPFGEEWVRIEEDFWSILVINHSHLGTQCPLFPHAKLNDGQLNLVLIYSNAGFLSLIDLAQMMTSGFGLRNTSYMTVIPVKAIRVLPQKPDSCYTLVDGDQVPSGPFQVEIRPSHFRVLTCPMDTALTEPL